MHSKNISHLIEWLKATHPELLKILLASPSKEIELSEDYFTENPTRILTPVSLFEGKIIVDRVSAGIKELQKSLKEKGIQDVKVTIDTLNDLKDKESAQNTFTQNIFFPALSSIILNKGSDEEMEVVQQRFALYDKTNNSGSFTFV